MLDYPKFPTALYFSSDYINSVFFAVAVLLLDNFKKSVSIFLWLILWRTKSCID